MKKSLFGLAVLMLACAGIASAGEIDPGLADILSATPAGQPVSVLVFLNDRVDLKAVSSQMDLQRAKLADRHETIVRALQLKAQNTQAPVVASLENMAAMAGFKDFRVFWIVNAFEVTASKELIELIARWPAVEKVYYDYEIEGIAPIEISAGDPGAGAAVESGVTAIRAPEVWAMGITGAGVLVANIDTGVEGDHPALASRWAGVADPRYAGHPEWAWYDPYLGQNTFPYDDGGHGTHTMGSICGGAPGDQIGVAPGAYWIAAAAIDRGGGIPRTVSDAILSFQWMLDPDGNPATSWDVPDVCSNSWGVTTSHGYAPCDPLFWSYIDACEAAGTVVVFAAGNEGTSGLRRPGDRATDAYRNFAVAAVDANTAGWPIAYFSSRGPTYCTPGGTAAIKPDISGPGVNVRSSYPGLTYTTMSGTSMATPHIAGVVALMRQANPDAPVDTIKQIIYETAYDLGTTGEDNNYGWGMVDAYKAVMRVKADTVPPVANFVGNPVSGYAPLGVQFTDQSSYSPTSWLWDFGDGTPTSTERNPYHTYANVGQYTVSLTATNAYGSDVETKVNYITASQAPITNIHVASLVVTRSSQPGRSWRGTATVTIVDELGVAVSGATVTGFFNAPNTKSKTATTGADGRGIINSDKTKTAPSDWCFEVTNVSKAGETYDRTKNVVTKACESGPVFRVITSVVPDEFSVTSYPNPFNPSTTIEMNLPVGGEWNISIYNITGQKVEEFTGDTPAGRVSVVWDASGYASGIYFYRVTAGQFSVSKKMVLMK
jgi:PKD repeat protein